MWPFIVGIGTVWGVLAPLCYSGANTDAAKKSSNFYKRMNPKDFEIVSDGQAPFAGASLVSAWNVLAPRLPVLLCRAASITMPARRTDTVIKS